MNKRNLGRSELAREAHFRKAGPTEKTGHERIKEQRQQDRIEEREAVLEREDEEAGGRQQEADSDL